MLILTRIKIVFMLFDNNDIINNVVEIINKYIFNNNDDQENDKVLINDIISSSINE